MGHPPADGRHLEDAAAPLPAHDGQGCAGEVHHPEQVGLHHVAELLGADLLKGRIELVAGVVHQHVQSAERLHCLSHRGLRRRLIADIQLDRMQPIAPSLPKLSQGVRRARPRHDGGPGPERRLRHVPTQAAAGACDQPDLDHRLAPRP